MKELLRRVGMLLGQLPLALASTQDERSFATQQATGSLEMVTLALTRF